jgi:cobalt/nickel transport system permease protein
MLSAAALTLSGREFQTAARVVLAAHLPVALLEGLVTANVVVLVRKVHPEVLEAPPLAVAAEGLGIGD